MGDNSFSGEFLLHSFCNEDLVLSYFKKYSNFLSEKKAVSKSDLEDLKKCLYFVEKAKVVHTNNQNVDTLADNICEIKNNNKLFDELKNILDSLHSHYLLRFLDDPLNNDVRDFCIGETLCELIPMLVKILIHKIQEKHIVEMIVTEICKYIKIKDKSENNFNEVSSAETHFCSITVFKFLSDIIQCIPGTNSKEYISEENLYTVLSILPTCDDKSRNFFAIHIFPQIMLISSTESKQKFSKFVWKIICKNFDSYLENEFGDRKFCPYTFLCCLCQNMFVMGKNENNYYPIYQEVKFWEIVQFGFTDNHPFTRKRSLHIFKQFYLWAQSVALTTLTVGSPIPIFSLKTEAFECSSVWNDIILLLEVLEENQVHVIKPLMPKFQKVVELAEKKLPIQSNNNFILHPSWIVFLTKRMLHHESAYIVKWTLLHSLAIKLPNFHILQKDNCFKLFLQIVIEAINNQVLYTRSEEQTEESLLLTQEKIHIFLKNCVLSLSHTNREAMFIKTILEIMARQSWCGVALLYMCCALSQLNDCHAWDQADLMFIRKLISEAHRTQEPMLRSAIQCYMLESSFKFLNWDSITFHDLNELLSVFKGNECFSRFCTQWSDCVSKLQFVFSKDFKGGITLEKAKLYCKECIERVHVGKEILNGTIEIEKFSMMLMILADSGVICPEHCLCSSTSECLHWSILLQPIVNILHSAPKRPYLNLQSFLNSLHLYTFLFKLCAEGQVFKDPHKKSLIKCLGDFSNVIGFIIEHIYTEIGNIKDIEKFNILFDALHVLSNCNELQCYFINVVPSCINQCDKILDESTVHKSMLFQLWKSLGWICEFYAKLSVKTDMFVHVHLEQMLKKIITTDIFETPFFKPEFMRDSSVKEEWLRTVNDSVCDVWKVICYGIQNLNFDEIIIKLIAQKALYALSTSAPPTVSSIMTCLKFLLPQLCSDIIPDTFECSWKACLELRRNEYFKPALSVFIGTIFQNATMNESHSILLSQYIKKLTDLSENSLGIFNFVVEHLCYNFTLMYVRLLGPNWVTIVTHALTFGPVHRKDQKVIEDAIFFVEEQEELLSTNKLLFGTHKPDVMVRVIAVNFLLENMRMNCKDDEAFALELIRNLFDVDKNVSQCRSSRFSNSLTHRVKNRAWQAILLLQSYVFSEESCKQMLSEVSNFLVMENQQPSVCYLQEWIATKIIIANPYLFEHFMGMIDSCAGKRIGFASSFLSILIHLIRCEAINAIILVQQSLSFVLQFCMSQNFNVRLHAQLALSIMWHLCKDKGFKDILAKYDFVEKLLVRPDDSASNYGNFSKNLSKLSNDFYFTSFDPINNYTIQTIFKELPRLSNLTSDEWIDPKLFKDSSKSDKHPLCIQYFNNDDKLAMSQPTIWSSKLPNMADHQQNAVYNFQKKITPWKDLLISETIDEDSKSKRKTDIREGLIVVASLIDRLPNLGGLCRTCEVFGVQEYIIGNLQYTEDKQFQNLAVTADKWVPIGEVKPHDLKSYLLAIKQEGYVIIAAEQTENSETLGNYVFPRKSVIVLGHEKEGVPVELIQMMDVCIEIPQQGIVRSLNVHVSGAILIWEYARQHLFDSNAS